MPVPLLAGGLLTSAIIVPLVVKVALAFGVTIISFAGLNALKDQAFDLITSQLSSLPADLLQLMGMINLDVYVTLVFSAYTTKLILKGVSSSGVLTKFGLSGAGA